MNLKIICIGLVVLAVFFFIGTSFSLKMGTYSDSKTLALCNAESEKQHAKDPKACAIWDGSQCRKGKTVGIMCSAPPNYVPLILLIKGSLCIIAAIGLAIYSKVSNNHKKND